jgi:hypothetical protein
MHEQNKEYVRCGLKSHGIKLLDDIYVCDYPSVPQGPTLCSSIILYQLEPATSFLTAPSL